MRIEEQKGSSIKEILGKNLNNSRLVVIQIFFLLMIAMIVVRLVWLQVINRDFFTQFGSKQRVIRLKPVARRGVIFDADGICLAYSKKKASLCIVPLDLNTGLAAQDAPAIACYHNLKTYFPKVAQEVEQKSTARFLWLERQVSAQRAAAIKELLGNYVHQIDEQTRVCVDESMACVVGITDRDERGLSGVEAVADTRLTGSSALLCLERDARKKKFTIGYELETTSCDGKNVHLTLKSSLHSSALQELEACVKKYQAASGSVLIMDPDTGDLLAMVDYPYSYTANNKSITSCYELGSVFKLFAALASLDSGVVTPDEMIACDGKVSYLRGFRLENWRPLYDLPFEEVIQKSSNVGLAKVVDRLGTGLYDHYSRLGFGQKTGITLPGEREGFLNPPDRWSKSSPYVLSFGYEVTTTLIQLARAFSILVNGGYAVSPNIIVRASNQEPVQKKSERLRLYPQSTIDIVQRIAERVGKRYPVGRCRVMGKTGTARCVEQGQYSTEKHRYTFMGAIEYGSYRRVIITFIEEPQQHDLWAAQVAAPLFQKIAQRILIQEGQAAAYCSA